MATPIIMPALGMAQETGRIVRWLKQEGEQVEAGEPIMEVETDKATVEIEAPAAGILRGIQAAEGDEVPVGNVVAWIVAPGETLETESPQASEPTQVAAPAEPAPPPEQRPKPTPVAARLAAEHQVPIEALPVSGRRIRREDVEAYLAARRDTRSGQVGSSTAEIPGRIPASPKARRLAAEYGVDLASVPGSGPEGAVLAADVLAYVGARTREPEILQAEPAFWTSSIWRTMARRVTQSWQQVPHFYLHREVDAQRLTVWREQVQRRTPIKLTYTDLLIKLVAAALRDYPFLNVMWADDAPRLLPTINVGLAVATGSGLVVPVIRAADQLRLPEIARRRQELVERAQAGTLRLEDVQEGGFTITNLGMYGVDTFHPIINAPQVAILAVGRIRERPAVVNGQLAVRPIMNLVLACDHRAVDGARAAQFLDTLVALIEEPLALLE